MGFQKWCDEFSSSLSTPSCRLHFCPCSLLGARRDKEPLPTLWRHDFAASLAASVASCRLVLSPASATSAAALGVRSATHAGTAADAGVAAEAVTAGADTAASISIIATLPSQARASRPPHSWALLRRPIGTVRPSIPSMSPTPIGTTETGGALPTQKQTPIESCRLDFRQ